MQIAASGVRPSALDAGTQFPVRGSISKKSTYVHLVVQDLGAMAGASTLFAAFPIARAPPAFSPRTRCSMPWHSSVFTGGGSMQRAFGIQRNGHVMALRPGLWRGVCRASDSTADGIATSPKPLEVVYDPQSRFEELAIEINSSSSAPVSNLTLFSPSKVNVFLRITGKRPDGYHDLASLFHVISLGDIIKFSVSPSTSKDSITTNASGVPLDGKNLIIKAFNLYREKTGTKKYFWVHLDKQVPTGAGLGGGSGNGATALWAANQMNGNIVSEKELQAWSGEIGADCPFFFSRGAAYCTKKGEVVQNIPPPIPLDTPMVLIKPPEECSTVEVYKRFSMDNASDKNPEDLLREIAENGISQSVCVNDLESPAFDVLPTLKALKERVLAASRGRYKAVFMSGSGSTIVGVGDSQPPQFIYDEDKYSDVFVSEAYFLIRKENEWYEQPTSEQLERLEDYEDMTCSIEKKICE